jgi:hypothetical protein
MTYDIDWLISSYMPFFKKFGMNEPNLRAEYEIWKGKTKNDRVKDYLWYIFQEMLMAVAKQFKTEKDFYTYNRDIYFKMWEFRIRVEKKKDNRLLQSIHECDVRLYMIDISYQFKVEMITGHCCSYCDSLDGKQVTPEDYLQNKYLASDQCTRESGCNCTVTSVSIRDANGRLILN